MLIAPGVLRLLLALIVLVAHYATLSGYRFHSPIHFVAVIGFFFLSGYWVTRLWDSAYSKAQYPLLVFYASRAWRIYPLAIIGTLLMAAAVPATPKLLTIIRNAQLFNLQLGHALNPPAWSLAIEVQFYLFAPLLFLLLPKPGWARLILTVGACAWGLFAFELIGTTLIAFLLPFALGIIYARAPRPDLARRLAPFSLAFFMVAGVLPNAFEPVVAGSTFERLSVIVLSLGTLPYIAACLDLRSSRLDRALGDLAYPVYLIHWPAFVLAGHFLPATALTAALSLLLWALIDRPSEQVRRAFVARSIAAQGPNAPQFSHAIGRPDLVADAAPIDSHRLVE